MTAKERQIWYWRKECESANRRRKVYPKDDERRKPYEEQYEKAKKTLEELLGAKL